MNMMIAWLLPLAAGIALWLAFTPRRSPGWLAAAAGYGSIFGLLLAALATACFARADTAHAWTHASLPLAIFAALVALVAWRRMRGQAAVAVEKVENANKWIIGLLALALASLVFRGWLMLREIWLRPTFPWDAWDAWAVKSKTWFLLGHYAPFVSMPDWLAHPARELYTGIAWAYPATLAWMQVWFASAAGGWIEPQVNLPWFALWIGLLLGHYGQWRALGVSRVIALSALYGLGSLPLLDVHVALAGYADLWLATILGFAALAWLRWRRERAFGQLAIAIVCAALLPVIKLEGAIWLLLCTAVVIYDALPRRWRRWALAVSAAVALLLVFASRIDLPVPGLGWVELSHSRIVVPALGEYVLAFHAEALSSVLNALFVQPNWHLLWWLAPCIALWRWRTLRDNAALRHLGAFVLLGFGFLVFLFVFTDASRWAESYTAVNRLILQLVPATVTVLAMLCRAEPHGTAASPVARSQPG
ncbi:MAG TPA: hypothetical protein PKD77_11230 [Rudaea sp.]|jgi:hypothetical protein|nr:hypothetical protein [Rudaea sp.]